MVFEYEKRMLLMVAWTYKKNMLLEIQIDDEIIKILNLTI